MAGLAHDRSPTFWIINASQIPTNMPSQDSREFIAWVELDNNIKAGDIVYLSNNFLINGWGEISHPPIAQEYYDQGKKLRLRVRAKADYLNSSVILNPNDPMIRNLGVLNIPFAAVRLAPSEALSLNGLIIERGYSAPPDPVLPEGYQPDAPFEADDLANEVEAARTIADPVRQTQALYDIAGKQTASNLHSDAISTYSYALEAINQISDNWLRQEWLNRISRVGYHFGYLAQETFSSASGDETPDTAPPTTFPASGLPGFSADVYSETDLLGIESDVEAFAQLIAARTMAPPLSIGLFGDWGSGKTFFMRHLKRRVEEIARMAEVSGFAQKDTAFYKHIIQIEFNAWHYSEGNLWASLVEHIFQNLRATEKDDEKTLKGRQESLLKKLEIENAAQLHAQEKERKARAKLTQKQKELDAVETRHKEELEKLAEVSGRDILASVHASLDLHPDIKQEAIDVLRESGVSAVDASARDLQNSLFEAHEVMSRVGNIFLPLVRAEDRRKRFLLLFVVVFAAIGTGLGIRWLTRNVDMSEFYATLSTIATMIASVTMWVRSQTRWVAEGLGKIARAKQKVDQQISGQVAEKKAEQEKEIATHRQQLELLRTEYNALRREREEAQRRVEEAQAEIRLSSSTQLLARFIQDRAASDDYRKHLGLLALIRRDFEKLSDLLHKDNVSLEEMDWNQEQKEKANRINRIVLYIDDLDRCQPSQVVAVLQAVHLLLAFRLFIVIVGVDGRWVTQSLRKIYPELLRDNRNGETGNSGMPTESSDNSLHAATSRDYLEKIFQIPFWLNPLAPQGTIKLLRGMLQSSIVEEQADVPPASLSQPAPPQEPESNEKETTSVPRESTEPPEASRVLSREPSQPASGVKLTKFDLNPKALNLRRRELDFMETLAPIIGRSPRSVKRFINTYRLLKVGLPPAEQEKFLRLKLPIAEFQVAMFLLGIETGLPSLSTEIFNRMGKSEDTPLSNRIASWSQDEIETFNEAQAAEFARLQRWFETQQDREWSRVTVAAFSDWLPVISRYSFNVERT